MKPDFKQITEEQIEKRNYWIGEIENLSGNFGDDFDRLQTKLRSEIKAEGSHSLLSHVRLCGAIPEHYPHDSSAEKLYSKYTDALLAETFQFLGITSLVLTERSDAADVECVARDYSFVADAKAFRLSRTAKNQKDFKVQAMDNWKNGKIYAMVVCPSYQLPSRSSQIYQQAISRNVCIFSYSHLIVLIQFAEKHGKQKAETALKMIFEMIGRLQPSKDAQSYWKALNSTLLNCHDYLSKVWRREKRATLEVVEIAKREALADLAKERERIMRLPRETALRELVRKSNIDNRETMIKRVSDSQILTMV